MTNQEAIKYLQQLYPNGGHCWPDEQRIEAIGMAVKALQEEPVSIWHDASEKPNYEKNAIIVITSYKGEYIGSRFYNPSDISCNIGVYDKWAYLNDLLNLSNVERTAKNWKEEPVSEDLEEAIDTYLKSYWGGEKEKQEWPFLKKMAIYFAEWQKQKDSIPVSDELEEACEQLAENARKHKAETSSPFFSQTDYRQGVVDGAKWQKEHLWKPADSGDLPEYEREVVVFTQNFPNDAGIMMVAIAHRPDPKGWDGKSITTGKVTRYHPKTYGKGGWNIPDVIFWLDVKLPKRD